MPLWDARLSEGAPGPLLNSTVAGLLSTVVLIVNGTAMELDAESRALIGDPPAPSRIAFESAPMRKRHLGPLHDLLLATCPREPDGVASIAKIGELLGMSGAAVYKWIEKGRLPGKRARALTALPGARRTISDFIPFMG